MNNAVESQKALETPRTTQSQKAPETMSWIDLATSPALMPSAPARGRFSPPFQTHSPLCSPQRPRLLCEARAGPSAPSTEAL